MVPQLERMRLIAGVLALVLLAAAPALAETRCERVERTPAVETQTRDILPALQSYRPEYSCRSTDGLMLTPERDASGAPILRDLKGNRVTGQADGFGVIVYPDAPASLAPSPNVEFRLPAGPMRFDSLVGPQAGVSVPAALPAGVEQSPVDSLGNSVVRDSFGGIKRCWTDPAGVTTCD